MSIINIKEIMKNLSTKRPIFHSELDFQISLAWEIKEKYSGKLEIRLERPVPVDVNQRIYPDIFIFKNKENLDLFELKYKKARLRTVINREEYNLSNDGAINFSRYDFINDVVRVETFKEIFKDQFEEINGYAILLTNEPQYWQIPGETHDITLDEEFRIHEGRTLFNRLSWKEGSNSKVGMKGKENPLILKENYYLIWQDFYEISDVSKGTFRYLSVKI